MKKLDEVQNYLENKREIFKTILLAIGEALRKDSTKILIKGIKIMDENVDAFATESEWQTCVEKAKDFFESIEDYESCQECMNILGKLKEKNKE